MTREEAYRFRRSIEQAAALQSDEQKTQWEEEHPEGEEGEEN